MKTIASNQDFSSFHYLIEIMVKLRATTIDAETQGGMLAKRYKSFWENRADRWIIENYKNPGIKKRDKKQ